MFITSTGMWTPGRFLSHPGFPAQSLDLSHRRMGFWMEKWPTLSSTTQNLVVPSLAHPGKAIGCTTQREDTSYLSLSWVVSISWACHLEGQQRLKTEALALEDPGSASLLPCDMSLTSLLLSFPSVKWGQWMLPAFEGHCEEQMKFCR